MTNVTKMKKKFFLIYLLMAVAILPASARKYDLSRLPGTDLVEKYVTEFNFFDEEKYMQEYPNDEAVGFLCANIPLFECPDKELEKTYYFRWWTYRKHIRNTPQGYVITEFLPDVPWAGMYNTISCPAAFHFNDGRWLHDGTYLSDYARFWVSPQAKPRSYSFPAADAIWGLYLVHRDVALIQDVYEGLKNNYAAWEESHCDSTGLYWQIDDRDGMEISVGGALNKDHSGYRPTINSYMYADAMALSKMARLLGKSTEEKLYRQKATEIKKGIDKWLWDDDADFYKSIPRHADMTVTPCREEFGYVPFMYGIPGKDKLIAWEQLFDEQGFKAPYGPTTVERRSPGFKIAYEGHECQWNGPSWPFATAQTLKGMAVSLHRYGEKVLTKERYLEVLTTFSNSQRLDGHCFIDENLNPFTGDWIARTLLKQRGDKIPDRGKDYNHSSFVDQIISGLIGIEADDKGRITVRPLVPDGSWDYYCLHNVQICGKNITVVYDKDGTHYGVGKGLHIIEN